MKQKFFEKFWRKFEEAVVNLESLGGMRELSIELLSLTNVVTNGLTNLYFSRYILEQTLKDKYRMMFDIVRGYFLLEISCFHLKENYRIRQTSQPRIRLSESSSITIRGRNDGIIHTRITCVRAECQR